MMIVIMDWKGCGEDYEVFSATVTTYTPRSRMDYLDCVEGTGDCSKAKSQ
jgi:hypothetical protein